MEKLRLSCSLLIYGLFLFSNLGCSEQDVESEAERAVRQLSNNGEKHWVIEKILLDEVSQSLTACDSSLILTIRADKTWREAYLRLSCYQLAEGSWSLNDENTVLSIVVINNSTGNEMKKDLEINELSDDRFEYQQIASNQIRRISLVEMGNR